MAQMLLFRANLRLLATSQTLDSGRLPALIARDRLEPGRVRGNRSRIGVVGFGRRRYVSGAKVGFG
jgi:hypothetical protein